MRKAISTFQAGFNGDVLKAIRRSDLTKAPHVKGIRGSRERAHSGDATMIATQLAKSTYVILGTYGRTGLFRPARQYH